MVLQDVENLVLILEIGTQMGDDLAHQFIQKRRMLVVADVVEVDQASDQVIFRLFLGHDAATAHQMMLFPPVELLDQNFVVDRLETDAGEVQLELLVAPCDVSHWLDRDPGDVDGEVIAQLDGLGNDIRNVDLWADSFKVALGRSDGGSDLFNDLLLDIRFSQIGRTREALVFPPDNLQSRLGGRLLLWRLEDQLRLIGQNAGPAGWLRRRLRDEAVDRRVRHDHARSPLGYSDDF